MLSLWPREATRVLMVESDEIMRKVVGREDIIMVRVVCGSWKW